MAKTGRPRGFDRESAFEQAMRLFWEHGYESTSLARLKAAMGGISSASFYAAFGSKEALFREVVERYLGTHGQVMAPLRDTGLPPRSAVESALRGSARMQTDTAHPLGCFITLSTAAWSPDNVHLKAVLAKERQRNRDDLRGCIGRAIQQGELRAGTDAEAVAAVLGTFLAGLTTQARDGVPLAALDAAVSELMSVWDAHGVRPPRTPGPSRHS